MTLVLPLFQWNGDRPLQRRSQDTRCQNESPGWYWWAAEEEDEARRRARPQLISPRDIVCATESFHFFKSCRSLDLKGGRTWHPITDQPPTALRHRCLYIVCSKCFMLTNEYCIYCSSSTINYSTLIASYVTIFRSAFMGIDLSVCKHTHLFSFICTSTNIPTLLFPASSHYDTLKRRSTPNAEWLICNNHSDSCHPRAITCRGNHWEPKVMIRKYCQL